MQMNKSKVVKKKKKYIMKTKIEPFVFFKLF